ncbi:cbb3-type cytochrome oxidase assembly protein CcoS [Vibrio rumoiensis]|uniref:Cytochrome oxidase maturation protein, cbb3-type n=1 Tax=Vibrio rumoiensis 1S-45 TaxID=1188252 RepID=A0A1E5E6N3_9VIBR|nr:cbb3-type cytochrome oxidase assembly protein CcoS [Vibrio rumoiensis]OEF30177.1 cytochrome oxidase maturation protein, cbb3-type [Vibrio rumoiensis 1S-45]
MESLYLLIPIAVIFVCIAVGIFIWAVKTDQFDDLDRQGHSILFDDSDEVKMKSEANSDTTSIVKEDKVEEK